MQLLERLHARIVDATVMDRLQPLDRDVRPFGDFTECGISTLRKQFFCTIEE